MSLHHIIGRPWAVTVEVALAALRLLEAEGFSALRRGVEFHAAWDHDNEARSRTVTRRGSDVAVIPVLGLLTQRGGFIDSEATTSTADLADAVRAAAADKDVSAIVLEMDTPGGEVYGLAEAAAAIREARDSKPIVAAANSMAGSAGYWLASQATELYVTPSGELGSVGVYAGHQDLSKNLELKGIKITLVHAGKYKVEGNPYEPLAEEARANIQADVDRYYGMFTRDVARGRGRGVTADSVRAGFGEGRMVGAKAAVEQNMADAMGTLDDAIRRAAALAAERRRGTAALAQVKLDRYRRERA